MEWENYSYDSVEILIQKLFDKSFLDKNDKND